VFAVDRRGTSLWRGNPHSWRNACGVFDLQVLADQQAIAVGGQIDERVINGDARAIVVPELPEVENRQRNRSGWSANVNDRHTINEENIRTNRKAAGKGDISEEPTGAARR
jgi:hypothetical protein